MLDKDLQKQIQDILQDKAPTMPIKILHPEMDDIDDDTSQALEQFIEEIQGMYGRTHPMLLMIMHITLTKELYDQGIEPIIMMEEGDE